MEMMFPLKLWCRNHLPVRTTAHFEQKPGCAWFVGVRFDARQWKVNQVPDLLLAEHFTR